MAYRIAVLLIAEAYQAYHAAMVASALAARPDVEALVIYNDPDTLRHLERAWAANGAPPVPTRPAAQTRLIRFLRRFPQAGLSKRMVMRANAAALDAFDAIVAVENTTAMLRHLGVDKPKLVYIPHGSGDRARSFVPRIAEFDLVLPAGPKNTARMLEAGLLRDGHYAQIGYPKFDAVDPVRKVERLFPDDRDVLLYNPHGMRDLGSWDRFAAPLADAVERGGQFNLVVAPHIKLFARFGAREKRAWEKRAGAHVIVDLASDRLLDMTYPAAADIYVGDVSSQVYEFLVRPRPCVFLNAHGIDWRNDPNYRNWTLGEVVDDPDELMPALLRARARHAEFLPLQRAAFAEAMGDASPGISIRAAAKIAEFLRDGRIAAPAE